jgi:NAD+ diphosphatase
VNYSHMTLDRCSAQRKCTTWTENEKKTNSIWLVMHKNKNLINFTTFELVYFDYPQFNEQEQANAIFLGKNADKSVFVLNIENELQAESIVYQQNWKFIDLRNIGPQLNEEEASIGALARALCYWHSTQQFCGRCGAKCKTIESGHARQCIATQCQATYFPRTDPAVIMLVTHTFNDGIERCLLGRQQVWPQGVFSTLAGFVDPGETIEQAVIREVKEESNINIKAVKYIASQPWPFPSSLMLGFLAQASSTDISVAQDELEDAKWFSRAELNDFDEWGDDSQNYKLTRKDSISRFLIELWRDQGK